MRICVFGAGAVGGHVAAKLAAAGHDVSVVARGAHLEAMRDKGITLIHGADTIHGKVRTSDPGLQDFVFVTLKANALGAFADAAAEPRRERHPQLCSRRTASRGGTASGFQRTGPRRPIFRALILTES